MKKTYQTPCMNIELFSANQAVSACTVQSNYKWKFDCMVGDTVDYRSGIISNSLEGSNCSNPIGYQSGCTTARDYNGTANHSNNSPSIANWTYVGNYWSGYSQVTYTGAQGLLYVDSDGKEAQHWSFDATNNMMVHDNSGNHMIHHNVAPVLNETSINPSW